MTTILRAEPKDADAVLAVQKQAFEVEALRVQNWDIPPMAEVLESVLEQIKEGFVLKAVVGDRLVGSIRGIPNGAVCGIHRLSVDQQFRGKGLGSALLLAIEQAHPDVSGFELVTNGAMEENVRFYVRHGYQVQERVRHSESITLVHMAKRSSGLAAA